MAILDLPWDAVSAITQMSGFPKALETQLRVSHAVAPLRPLASASNSSFWEQLIPQANFHADQDKLFQVPITKME